MDDFSALAVSFCPDDSSIAALSNSKYVDHVEKGVEGDFEEMDNFILILCQMDSKSNDWDAEYREIVEQHGPIIFDPVRRLRSETIGVAPPPPKLFYRTFWAKVAWRLLQQSRQQARRSVDKD